MCDVCLHAKCGCASIDATSSCVLSDGHLHSACCCVSNIPLGEDPLKGEGLLGIFLNEKLCSLAYLLGMEG